jgi:hypothetical protein
MLKKLLALFLACVMALSLVACGGNDDATKPIDSNKETVATNPSEGDVVVDPTVNTDEPDVTQPSEPENSSTWTVKEMSFPPLDRLIVEKKPIIEGVNVAIAKTPLEIDLDSVKDQVAQLDFVKEYYTDFAYSTNEYVDGEFYNDAGYQFSYWGFDEYGANLKTNEYSKFYLQNDLSFGGERDSSEYSNYKALYLHIHDVPVGQLSQDDIYEVAKLVFGEYAEYLVYAKDSDGVNTSNKNVQEGNMSEWIELDDDTIYAATREIEENYEGLLDYSFRIYVYQNPYKDWNLDCYGKDVTPIYDSFTYKFEDLLSEDFGNRDIFTYSTFGDKYFSEMKSETDYTVTSIDHCSVKKAISADGTMYYEILFNVYGWVDGMKASELSYGYEYIEKDGEIAYIDGSIKGDLYNYQNLVDVTNKDAACKAMMKDIRGAISKLMPDLDLTGVEYDTAESEFPRDYGKSYSIDTVFMGRPITVRLNTNMSGNNSWSNGDFSMYFTYQP